MNRHRSTGRLEHSGSVANCAGPPAQGQKRKLALGGPRAFNTRKYEQFYRLTGGGSRAHSSAVVLPEGPRAGIGRILVVVSEATGFGAPIRSLASEWG